MVGFLLVMLLANAVVTGFARLPLSTSRSRHPTIERWFGSQQAGAIARCYETSIPQDWVGFATQLYHQASGGPSYLFGERRIKGWWHYYLAALAVKVPPAFWILVAARIGLRRSYMSNSMRNPCDTMLPLVILLYISVIAVGSSRNYGVRYLLPLGPLAIIWISAVGAELRSIGERVTILINFIVVASLTGYAGAVMGIHPHELTYFNIFAGGSLGGRQILADSNLDWGQGLKSLARLQRQYPELADLTFYYFGDTDPIHYGVTGSSYTINAIADNSRLAALKSLKTGFIAVSASLEWGPWGPPGFFEGLRPLNPVLLTDDTTIAIYRTSDLRQTQVNEVFGPTPK